MNDALIAAVETAHLDQGPVRIGADSVAEMDHGRPLVSVPRAEILRLELLYGSGAERPLICIILGVVLAIIAFAGPVMLAVAIVRHGSVPAKLVTSIAFIIPALWLLDLAFRQRWYVRVHTTRGSRKLLFPRDSDTEELKRFIVSAKARYGYS